MLPAIDVKFVYIHHCLLGLGIKYIHELMGRRGVTEEAGMPLILLHLYVYFYVFASCLNICHKTLYSSFLLPTFCSRLPPPFSWSYGVDVLQ